MRILAENELEKKLLASLSGASSQDIGDLQDQLAQISPLNPLPFETALSLSVANREVDKANELATAILSRQPRSLAARLYRFSHAAKTSSFDDLIAEYEVLYALNTIDRSTLNSALVGVFLSTQGWDTIVEYLKTHPDSGDSIMAIMIDNAWTDVDLIQLVNLYPEVQTKFLEKLIKNDRYLEAQNAWIFFEDLNADVLQTDPFNNQFQDRAEKAPFNWKLDSAVAELQENGGLYVRYRGQKPVTVASQIISLVVGDYVLRSEAEGRITGSGGNLTWVLRCAQNREVLAELDIALDRFEERQIFQTEVSIGPADCEFQELVLNGRPGAFPETSTTRVHSVSFVESFSVP
ncbi:MAG: hypothetical protein AAGL97_02775 [Pseudomonadota bacterium]